MPALPSCYATHAVFIAPSSRLAFLRRDATALDRQNLSGEDSMPVKIDRLQPEGVNVRMQQGKAAYSQNVIMNIADKRQFYREAFRALRPGGRLALSNLCAGPSGEPYFPVPWATTRDMSFLAAPDEMRADLLAAGFEIADFRDITAQTREAQRRTRERIDKGDMPKIAVDIIMGERAPEMQWNSIRTIEEGRGLAIEALVRKPG